MASGIRPSRPSERSSSTRLELRDEPDRPVEEADEDEEGRQPLAQGRELGVVGVRRERFGGFSLLLLEHRDDRVALADLPLGDDPAEPLPVVADRQVGGPGRPAATDPPRLGDALDDPPRFGLGQGQAGGAVAQAQAPRGPRARSAAPGGPSGRPGPGRSPASRPRPRPSRPRPGRARCGWPRRSCSAACRRRSRRAWPHRSDNLRLDSSLFIAHNLLCQSSTEDAR